MNSRSVLTNRISSRRNSMAIHIVANWVKINRPDVWKVAYDEALKKHPPLKRNKPTVPKSMQGIKP